MTCNGCGAGTPRINNADPFPEKNDANVWRSGTGQAEPLTPDELAEANAISGYPPTYNPEGPFIGPVHEEMPFGRFRGNVTFMDSNINSDSLLSRINVSLAELKVAPTDGECGATSKGCQQVTGCTWVVTHSWLVTYSFTVDLEFDADPGLPAVESYTSPPVLSQTSMTGTGESTTITAQTVRGQVNNELVDYETVYTVVHEITIAVDCDSDGEQTLAYDVIGGSDGPYSITPDTFDWTSAQEDEESLLAGPAVQEITLQLPCLPCVVGGAGGGDPPAPGSSSSSSPFLRIREGD